MSILNFKWRNRDKSASFGDMLNGFSIEVMPRTAAKIEDFRAILPRGTRVYIAHIEGTPIDEMVATAKRLAADGFSVMPHVPARIISNRQELETWIARYAEEAGVTEALVLAGGPSTPAGEFDSSIKLLETGVFQKNGFTRLHVAGHPEGNRDIDPNGGTQAVDEALRWKQGFADETGIDMAITTQFAFDAAVVTAWTERLQAQGIRMPINVGIAGPAKLQTMLKFAITCGVGPSLSVLQKRAKDVTKLVLPYEPEEVLSDLSGYLNRSPDSLIAGVHFFPLGGIRATTDYISRQSDNPAAFSSTRSS